jgi:outer membrane lipoprotein-sorting protein
MRQQSSSWSRTAVAAAMFVIPPALGDAGDTYRVEADRLNLRAGPSDESAVRSVLQEGHQLIELQREDGWIGVRVIDTGEEGWVYDELVRKVAESKLDVGATSGPFAPYSATFDALIARINDYLGYPIVAAVERAGENTLRITPTSDWLRGGDTQSHLMAAMGFYQMWKNHQNGAPVTLVMMDNQGQDYIRINDSESGPLLSIQPSSPR